MAHSARVIANEFIRRGVQDGRPLTPLQIMKLVYLAHGWMLAIYDRPLVTDKFEAWRYGPVVDDLYQAMKMYRADPVEEPLPLTPIASVARDGRISLKPTQPRPFDQQEQHVIDVTYNYYGSWTASQLVQITHRQGTPWYRAWFGFGAWGTPLPDRQISKSFKARLVS